jgi:hypothetical protein
MKAWTLLTIIMVATTNLVTACGSSGTGCESICNHISECEPEGDKQECITMCNGIEQTFRSSAWTNVTSCILDLPCGANFDPNTCIVEAANKESADVIDDMATRVCTRNSDCGDQTPIADCVTEAKQSDAGIIFRLFADSVLNCVATCVEGTDCAQVEEAFDTCVPQCGISLELDEE